MFRDAVEKKYQWVGGDFGWKRFRIARQLDPLEVRGVSLVWGSCVEAENLDELYVALLGNRRYWLADRSLVVDGRIRARV